MSQHKKAAIAAFPHTLPVLAGYIFLGIAFGILLQSKGFGVQWAFLMSLLVYAGSMQFVAVALLAAGFQPVTAAVMTLMVNARHLFYSISMLEQFKIFGREKLYMIFSLTDETFSLLCSTKPPEGVDDRRFFFWISLLDHFYWVTGSVLGSLLGSAIVFDSTGIDFVMTALFTVIFLEQWHHKPGRLPALAGLVGSFACLLVFGSQWFIIPAMLLLVMILSGMRSKMEEVLDGD